VQRPAAPANPPNPEELKARPDAQGKVRFNFTGQPWPAVLTWLAEVSGMSLDWQELPGDYLNLVTQRSYTLDEARDLINRHLLARGFTLIQQGEVLTVASIKKLDPGMVPRVAPAELDKRSPYDFVRVSFPLDWLLAETAVEEIKPMLSPNGKLAALSSTNRLEAMDAVVNLREIRRLLAEEQSGEGQERLVREFVLQYARASEVLEQLQPLVGVEGKPALGSSSQRGGMSPEQIQQMQQQMQQAIQQAQQSQHGGKGAPPSMKPKPEVKLVVNKRRNSVVAHAPANKMAIIEQAVKTLDVPAPQGEQLLANVARMQVYRLAAIDPEPLVKTLEELGGLDPTTRLQVDKANKSIIVYAPLADHVTIRALIDKLDGSGRRFEVVQLRRLEADYVAGTIDFMINGPPQKQSERRPWDFWGHSDHRQSDEKPSGFRVDADVEYNRLLLWANEIELAEVQKLLVKLGEVPAGGNNPSTVRVIDAPAGPETEQWLERLRRAWPSVAPNPLVLPPPQEPDEPDAKPSGPAKSKPAGPAAPANPPTPWAPPGVPIHMVQLRQEPAEPAAATAPPVKITRTPDGRLIVSCPDPQALDRMEELMDQLAPPARTDYKIFRLRYAWAYGVASILRDLFKDEDKDSRRRWYNPWDYPSGRDEDKSRTRLSKRRALKILSDTDTNSILVQGGDAGQLRKIEELIEFYDRVEPTDARSVRKTEIFHLRYSQAKVVAETIKDVYRDLLSANDKSLQGADKQKPPERSYTFVFDSAGDSGSEQKVPKFKGLLSIGIDELSNTLIISAPAFLLDDVRPMVLNLDQAAEPTYTKVEVIKLGQGASAAQVRRALSSLYGTPVSGAEGDSSGRAASKPGLQGTGRPGQERSSGSRGSGHNHGDNRQRGAN